MKKRIIYFDVLNILATLGVVFMHCNGLAHEYKDTLGWKQALLVEVVCFWAVPVFFMLSGATLMSYREKYTTKDFFIKRIKRTVIPFLAWSLIIAVLKRINPIEIGIIPFLGKIIYTGIESIYWFFIPLFAIYISMPVLSSLKDNRRILWYMFIGGFLLNTVLPNATAVLGLPWNTGLTMLTAGGYTIFPILGYLISTEEFKKVHRIIIYLVGIIGAVYRYVIIYVQSTAAGQITQKHFDYLQWDSVALATAVFVFFRYLPLCNKLSENKKITKNISIISGCSFGIYLTHMTLRRFLEAHIESNCWQWRLFAPLLIYTVCLLCVWLLKKIPIVKNIVP